MVVAGAAVSESGSGRRVLDGAFMLLDVISCAENGLGVADLARKTGLAKTTVHRLAEQLVEIGAAQRVENRYFVGPTIARLGQCWQPDPELRQAACEPVRTLAVRAHTAAAMYMLYNGRAHLVTAAVCPGQSWLPPADVDAESLRHTLIARVLLLPTMGGDQAEVTNRPGQRRAPSDLIEWRRCVTDDQDAAGAIRWVAARVWPSDARCVAAVAALFAAPAAPAFLKDLVICAARQITDRLRQQECLGQPRSDGPPEGR